MANKNSNKYKLNNNKYNSIRKKGHQKVKMINMMTFFLLLILVGLFVYFYVIGTWITSEPNKLDNNNYNDEVEVSTAASESDADIIRDFFAEGMSSTDFSDTKNATTSYLPKDNERYEIINYNFDKLLTYEEIENMVKMLNRSKTVNVEIIGKSVDDRNIYSIEIGSGKKEILFEANIHAAEIGGTLFIMKYIKDLVNDFEIEEKSAIDLLKEIKIRVIPSVNPDGYEATQFGYKKIKNKNLYIATNHMNIDFNYYKANANGIDLNRALPSQHAGLYYKEFELASSVSNKPSIGDYDYYPGTTLGSEPETKALIYWQYKYLPNAYAYIALHSAGRVVYNGKPNLSSSFNNNSMKLAKLIGETNEYKVLDKEDEDVGTGDDGTATDFASEIISGFKYNSVTGRLSANKYKKPTIKSTNPTGVIVIETLEEYTFDIKRIKDEYYDQKLYTVFDKLIKSYNKIK